MKGFALVVLCAVRAAAGPAGSVDEHAVAATGYAGAYLGALSLSLAEEPRYGARLLDSLELHLRSVAAMTAPRAVTDYFEIAVIGSGVGSAQALTTSLGTEPMNPQRAAALLLAHALARPEQFYEVLDGLEARRAGLGKHTAKLLRETKGTGDKRLIAALRSRGAPQTGAALLYARFGQLEPIFAGAGVERQEEVVAVPSAEPRRAGVEPARD